MRIVTLGLDAEELARGLLDAGSPRGTLGWTPLQYACAIGDLELAREALGSSDDTSATATAVADCGQTKYQYSPLHLAARFGHVELVDLLLEHGGGGGIDRLPSDAVLGSTPLHMAVLQGHLTIVQRLLAASPTVQVTNNGTTPYELAKRLGYTEISNVLLDHERRTRNRELLGQWLASIGMIEYAPHLEAAGFEDPHFLLVEGLRDDVLDSMGITKPGHRSKIQSLYQLREFLGMQEDNGEDEEDGEDDDDDGDRDDSDDRDDGSDAPLDEDSSDDDE